MSLLATILMIVFGGLITLAGAAWFVVYLVQLFSKNPGSGGPPPRR